MKKTRGRLRFWVERTEKASLGSGYLSEDPGEAERKP